LLADLAVFDLPEAAIDLVYACLDRADQFIDRLRL